MANEITLTASLSFLKSAIMSSAVARSIQNLLRNVNANNWIEGTVAIAVSPGTAFPLGAVTAPHWAWFNNTDPTNSFTLRNGSGGTDLCSFIAGDMSPIPLLSTSVPWGIAIGGAVNVEYLIIGL